jgi:hypothetical protein
VETGHAATKTSGGKMKQRRVIVEIELETSLSIKDLKWNYKLPLHVHGEYINPIQVGVNVVRVPEPKKVAKRR